MTGLRRNETLSLLGLLNAELERYDVCGELYLVGGAVMCLAFDSDQITDNVRGFFHPASVVREAALRVTEFKELPEDWNWLNDSVKEFLGETREFQTYLSLPHLRVLTASPEYLLTMKCLATRSIREFHDQADVRFLLRYLNIERYDAAVATMTRYWPEDKIPRDVLWALEEMIADIAVA